ncbi:uncharacterized protein LOC8271498 isoform X2 [Ricinus communis]|uniref:uncharacterized protein LOC8271498 isoform X2 n=1 Tax=Ricinus communis TaxID=3988 RepID=UPI00201A5985|nr:uncharacterized protein LOC8271498 isoform X2 [Ricinus communis]
MNPTAQCSCMVPHCSPADPNLFNNNIRLETDSDNDNIFRSLSDIQSIPFLQQQGSPTTCQFTPLLLCHEESSASSKTKSTETRLDISRGIPGALKTNKLGQNHRRTRSATYERRRRNRIREKLKALGELIPHSHKVRASMMSNMGGGALCQASSMSAAHYFCPVMPMDPTSATRMFSTSQYVGALMVPPPSVHPHFQLHPSSLPATAQFRQPFIFSLPLLGAAISTPLSTASSYQGQSTTSRKQKRRL